MNFVRNKTRLKGDINTVIRSLTSIEKIAKWTETTPIKIGTPHIQCVDWTVSYGGEHVIECQFHVMRCAAKTEFCIEVHLVAVVVDGDVQGIDDFSKTLLENLRQSFNKSWVIGDNELNASVFLESF